ncbi:MAG TPA: polysaccharide deacetylase family protein [Bacillota bacterium]|jgi:peptidoglycan/xylan/chitin deacetylase (PgdA/CDA1 family)
MSQIRKNRSAITLILLVASAAWAFSVTFENSGLARANALLEESGSQLKDDYSLVELQSATVAEENIDLQARLFELQARLAELERVKAEETTPPLPHREQNRPTVRTAYLTFDDGPSQNTAKVLDILKEYGVKATFFVCGNPSEFGRNMYRRMKDEGHAIGNHTYSHNYRTIYASVDAYLADARKLDDLVQQTLGERPTLMRFPGGSDNRVSWQFGGKKLMSELTERALAEGYFYDDWNDSGQDAAVQTQDKATIVRSVLAGAAHRQAVIVLLHDSSSKTTTPEALPEIIEGLRDMGYTFATLSPSTFNVQFTY